MSRTVNTETQVTERNIKGRIKMLDSEHTLLRFVQIREGLENEAEAAAWIIKQYLTENKIEEKFQKAMA